MASPTRVTLNLMISASLVVAAIVGCSRAKPIPTPTSLTEGTSTPGGELGVGASEETPSPTARINTPTPLPPTVTPVPTATPVPATPTATAVPPTPTPGTENVDAVVPTVTPPVEDAAVAQELSYTVKWGDSLWALARAFDTTIEEIASRNGLIDTDFIRVGHVLRIETAGSAQPASTVDYVVQHGDSLSLLAQRFGTSVEQLQRTNGIVNPWYIYAGQTLEIPSGASASEATGTPYTVSPGDTLWHVAIRYGTTVWRIRIANNIRNPDLIYPGQVLIIP